MSAITDKIAEVLREHDPTRMECHDHDGHCCPAGDAHSFESIYAHVAEAIAVAIEPEIRADECRRAADDLIERAGPIAYPWAADLRHRAEQHEKERA